VAFNPWNEGKKKVNLRPSPKKKQWLGQRFKYYIEMWKMGTPQDDMIATEFHTANLKHVIQLILKTNHSILFLKRSHDGHVIWDKR